MYPSKCFNSWIRFSGAWDRKLYSITTQGDPNFAVLPHLVPSLPTPAAQQAVAACTTGNSCTSAVAACTAVLYCCCSRLFYFVQLFYCQWPRQGVIWSPASFIFSSTLYTHNIKAQLKHATTQSHHARSMNSHLHR